MINRVADSVSAYVNSEYNPFNKESGVYYITRQTLEDIYEDNKKKEVRRHKALGIIIGNLALFSALGVFFLFKGLPVGIYRKLRNLVPQLEEKVMYNNEPSNLQRFRARMLKWTRKKFEQARSVNNFTSFKDLLFKKLMYKTKPTAKIHDGITNCFEKLSKATVNRKYGAFENSYVSLEKAFDKVKINEPNKLITINGITKTAQEWLDQTMQLRGSISAKISKNFGSAEREVRYKFMKQSTEGLEERVLEKSREGISKDAKLNENFNVLKNSDVAQSFIAEDLLAPDKLDITRNLRIFRNEITRSVNDDYKASRELIEELKRALDLNDNTVRECLKFLEGNLIAYKKLSGPMEAQAREHVVENIICQAELIKENLRLTKCHYDEKTMKSLVKGVNEIENIVCSNKKGEFQELLTIYKHILPRDEYEKLRSRTNTCASKLDKAIATESDEFFDKLRDLKLGSAPTDVLTILTSLGSVGLGLGLAKDRDERISAALKYGIPVAGGIATTLVMTSSLISGFKGMAAGILSSILLSELGDITDKFRKNINKRFKELEVNEQISKDKNLAEIQVLEKAA